MCISRVKVEGKEGKERRAASEGLALESKAGIMSNTELLMNITRRVKGKSSGTGGLPKFGFTFLNSFVYIDRRLCSVAEQIASRYPSTKTGRKIPLFFCSFCLKISSS